MSTEETVFISPVGRQLAAVLVPLKTYVRRRETPKRVVLVPTSDPKGTNATAGRLESMVESITGLRPEIRAAASTRWVDGMAAVVRDTRRQEHACRIIVNITPGLGFHVAALAYLMRDIEGITAVYADATHLLDVGGDESVELVDLGLDDLLALHGLTGEQKEGRWILQRNGRNVIELDDIYERAGRLHGILEAVQSVKDARQIIAVTREPARLNYLRPQILAVAANGKSHRRLLAANVDTVWIDAARSPQDPKNRIAREKIDSWRRRRAGPPGRPPAQHPTGHPSLSVKGGGGEGPPLIVCLGNDPSATLTALYSHRPQVALVLFDSQTPHVLELAERLAKRGHDLPAGTLSFEDVDLDGSGIEETRLGRWFVLGPGDRILANVSPGTKAQAWMLGRLNLAEPCSIRNGPMDVVSLVDGRSVARVQVPGTEVQAAICGGDLQSTGTSGADLAVRRDFLSSLARWVAEQASTAKRGTVDLHAIVDATGTSADRFTVKVPGKSGPPVVGTLPGNPFQGFWLEEVAAAALLDAGAEDLRVGMRWAWPRSRDTSAFQAEIDVAFQWKRRFVAVSVKSASVPRREDTHGMRPTIDEVRAEIVAEAKTRFGRFCLPVLVRPVRPGAAKWPRARGVLQSEGLLEIGLCQLGDAGGLSAWIDDAFATLRTVDVSS